jgi:hypothetical protein
LLDTTREEVPIVAAAENSTAAYTVEVGVICTFAVAQGAGEQLISEALAVATDITSNAADRNSA